MNLKGKLKIVERTDVGLVREHNEDFVSSDARLGIAVLADGMGGLSAGEVASSMSVHVLMHGLSRFVRGESTPEESTPGESSPEESTPESTTSARPLDTLIRQEEEIEEASELGLQSRVVKAVVE